MRASKTDDVSSWPEEGAEDPLEPDQPEPVPSAAPAARRLLVLCAIIGFVLGGGVVSLLWSLSGVHAGANVDAKAACDALARVGEIPDNSIPGASLRVKPVTDDRLRRMAAARELAAAAAAADSTYKPLFDHLDVASRMVLALQFSDVEGQRNLRQARELCAQI